MADDLLTQQIPPHSDNVEEELQRVRLALDTVFSPTHQGNSSQWWEQRQLADRYLTSFQGTTLAWMVCDRLLQDGDSNDPQSVIVVQQRRFFAAQTLHIKCRAGVHQLPESSLPSLRDSLLAHLNRYSSAENIALTSRIAMCISALAVQMGWTTIVNDLIMTHPNHILAMFVVQTLPEENASDRLFLLDDSKRYAMRDHLVSSASLVFQMLLKSVQEGQLSRVFVVLHTWIRYVPIKPNVILESPLLQASFQMMTQPQHLEEASDVVVEVLRMYPSHRRENEGLVKQMIPLLSQLPFDEALRSEDEDVLRAYCRVVTEMGECYMSWILSAEHKDACKLVSWVLRCSEIADSEIASITLLFWYRLAIDLECIEPYEWRQELVDAYTPHLIGLIKVCVTNLMRFPPDIDEIAQDLVEDLHRVRVRVSETIEDCCRLLGGQIVLRTVGNMLRHEVKKISECLQTEWQGLEACFACISSIHRFIPSDESDYLPLCFSLMPRLPPEVHPLRFTASKTIGLFAAWLVVHSELLQPLMPYLAQGLSIPKCAPAAAVAIKELCKCSNQNFAIAEPVLEKYQEITSPPGQLDIVDELNILEGVCRALSRQIKDTGDSGASFLARLVQPIGNRLAASVAAADASPRQIITEIERVTVIVQFFTVPAVEPGPHPIVDLMRSIWNFLHTATSRFPNDYMLAEKICRLHKHALRACGPAFYSPVLESLMQELVFSFEATHQSPFLYAASICITEYSHDPAWETRLFNMVGSLATITFSFLRTLDDLTNHPDVVEELFYLMGRVISGCPDPLVKSPLLLSLFQCAVVGMQLDHHGANKGTLKFLENIISYGLSLREQNKPECKVALEQVLSQEGKAIATNLARAMVGDLPAYSNQIPEIVWKFNLLCPALLAQWLKTAFENNQQAAALCSERVKNDFMGALNTGLARDEFSLAVRAFQTACEKERRIRKAQRGT